MAMGASTTDSNQSIATYLSCSIAISTARLACSRRSLARVYRKRLIHFMSAVGKKQQNINSHRKLQNFRFSQN